MGVSNICVITSAKYHGYMNYLAMGCFGGRQMALFLAYKGSGENIAQMGLAPKDEVQVMQKYSSPEFIRIYGDA